MSRGFHPTKDDLLGIPSIEDVAIPLVIITLDLVAIPLVVSTIMKGKPFQFQFLLCLLASFTLARVQVAERAIAALLPSPPSVIL